MANIINEAMAVQLSDQELLPAAADDAVVAKPSKSEGQALFDRMSATRSRLAKVARRFDQVKATIAPRSTPGLPPTFGSAPKLTSFFQGMHFMAGEFEQLTDALEASVEDLANLF